MKAEKHECFEYLPSRRSLPILLVNEHASNHIPASYRDLGLAPADLKRHIAYDIGTQAITRLLSDSMGVDAIFGVNSRLLIDLNRAEDDPTLIREIYDGIIIPGNTNLDADECALRLAKYYDPFHHKVDLVIKSMLEQFSSVVLVNVHSFTPALITGGPSRIWEIGILSHHNRKLADGLIKELSKDKDMVIGDNKPYSGMDIVKTIHHHDDGVKVNAVAIEFRQDLVEHKAGQQLWADNLSAALTRLLAARA